MAEKGVLAIGMDVGSTTVKAVVVDPETKKILWSDYQRHHTKQPEKVVELLEAIFAALPDQPIDRFRMFMTGSGAAPLSLPPASLTSCSSPLSRGTPPPRAGRWRPHRTNPRRS